MWYQLNKLIKYGATRRRHIQWRRQVRREEAQWLDKVVGAAGRGHFFILLFMVSNLGAAKSIAPYEATVPG